MDDGYEIGTITSGRLIGRDTHIFIWLRCDGCGKERWVQLDSTKTQANLGRCKRCVMLGKEHGPNWKGGRVRGGGKGRPYIDIWVKEDDFFYPMVRVQQLGGGYVAEHRLVMARHLGRCLHSWEIVHHQNGNKVDNHIENLQLVSDLGHKQINLMEKKIQRLQRENQELRKQLLQEIQLS